MQKEEIIMSMEDSVDFLVKKYNNHTLDEDLHSVGMIGVVECVGNCLKKGMTDLSSIQKMANRAARNRILSEIYAPKPKIDEDASVDDSCYEDDTELYIYLEQVLTPKEREIFNLLLEGCSRDEILVKMNIKNPTYYEYCDKIRKKIHNTIP